MKYWSNPSLGIDKAAVKEDAKHVSTRGRSIALAAIVILSLVTVVCIMLVAGEASTLDDTDMVRRQLPAEGLVGVRAEFAGLLATNETSLSVAGVPSVINTATPLITDSSQAGSSIADSSNNTPVSSNGAADESVPNISSMPPAPTFSMQSPTFASIDPSNSDLMSPFDGASTLFPTPTPDADTPMSSLTSLPETGIEQTSSILATAASVLESIASTAGAPVGQSTGGALPTASPLSTPSAISDSVGSVLSQATDEAGSVINEGTGVSLSPNGPVASDIIDETSASVASAMPSLPAGDAPVSPQLPVAGAVPASESPSVLPAGQSDAAGQLEGALESQAAGDSDDGTMNTVINEGTTIINQLSDEGDDEQDSEVDEMIKKVEDMVESASDQLEEPLCLANETINGEQQQIVTPCASIAVQPSQQPAEQAPADDSDSSSTTAAEPYDSGSGGSDNTSASSSTSSDDQPVPDSQSTGPKSPPPLPPPNAPESQDDTPTTTSSDGSSGGSPTCSCPIEKPCPTCPTCNDDDDEETPDGSFGPDCPHAFKCDDCPSGWFCPPSETPALPAPCGVGWLCYHCSSGWFCDSTDVDSNSSSSGKGSPSDTSAGTSAQQTSSPDSGANDGGSIEPDTFSSPEMPDDWGYLGCFHDAISRTLLGAEPDDFVCGDINPSSCVYHCLSKGYTFAGTENASECWCGTSIRDDAVRLPEPYCNAPCEGDAEAVCGGSWTISVFEKDSSGQDSEDGEAPESYGPSRGLLLAEKHHRGLRQRRRRGFASLGISI